MLTYVLLLDGVFYRITQEILDGFQQKLAGWIENELRKHPLNFGNSDKGHFQELVFNHNGHY